MIQTYNATAYQICNADDTSETDTFVYSGGNEIGRSVILSIPLTIEGNNYFFSDTDDGIQCQQGMAFKIDVKHGLGLPPNLNQPPPPPFVDQSPPSDSDQSTPTTTSTQNERFYKGGVGRLMTCNPNLSIGFIFGVFCLGLWF